MNAEDVREIEEAYYRLVAESKTLLDGTLDQDRKGIWRQFRASANGGDWCAVQDGEVLALMKELVTRETINSKIKRTPTPTSVDLPGTNAPAKREALPTSDAPTPSAGDLSTPQGRAMLALIAKPTTEVIGASWAAITARYSGGKRTSLGNVPERWRTAVERATARIEAERGGKPADAHGWNESAKRIGAIDRDAA